ncbi:unnamed protein product [Urochloa humidicola]
MCTDLTRSSTRAGVDKPAYGGFIDINIEEHKIIKLRILMSSAASLTYYLSTIHKGKSNDLKHIDHLMVESFGVEGRACITTRLYPEHAETSNSRMFVFNNGMYMVKIAKLDAWDLVAATVNIVEDEATKGLIASELKGQRKSY